jgi:hypothetical protein
MGTLLTIAFAAAVALDQPVEFAALSLLHELDGEDLFLAD